MLGVQWKEYKIKSKKNIYDIEVVIAKSSRD